jgi:Flp pilus assembly protein TadB
VTLTWVLLAAALLLAGGAPPDREARRPLSPRTLQVLAVAASTAGCMAAGGVTRGGLVAIVVAPLAAFGMTRVRERATTGPVSGSLALALDLVAVTLRAGQPLSTALVLVAPVADDGCGDRLAHVGGLLRLGADPRVAWQLVADDRTLAPVAAAAVRSASSGLRLATTFERLAAEVRAQQRSAAEARAQRAGVWAAAPLGLCFLPSFVCLGIAPIIIGIAAGVLTGSG